MAEKSPELQEVLKATFDEFDKNGDGKITKKELRKAMKKHFGEKLSKEETKELLDGTDDDGNGTVDFKEFCSMMLGEGEETN